MQHDSTRYQAARQSPKGNSQVEAPAAVCNVGDYAMPTSHGVGWLSGLKPPQTP